MTPRFSLNTGLTLGVNAPYVPEFYIVYIVCTSIVNETMYIIHHHFFFVVQVKPKP
jgi:hypothetical protein